MFKLLKIPISVLTLCVLIIQSVSAAPVNMPLTYDGITHQYNAESIELQINGTRITPELMPPIVLEGRTYVPSREVFEPLGAAIDWKDASKELYIGYDGTLIVMKADSKTADVNGTLVELESPAKIINDKLMIPARFVAEQLGIPVNWDPNNRIVSIGSAPAEEPSPAQENPDAQSGTEAPAEQPAQPVQQAQQTPGLSVDISTQPLTEVPGAPVNITSVSASGTVFTVAASGGISKVEKTVLPENKLVLDIYNATNAISSNSYTPEGFSGVSAVRNSQFSSEPDKITRVVFDLVGQNRFSVSFGAERMSVVVSFEQNTVMDVSYKELALGDEVTITGTIATTVNASRLFSPDRLVLDISGATYAGPPTEMPINSRFIDKIRGSQFDASTARVVIDLVNNSQYKVDYQGNSAIITLTEATYKNITYAQQPLTSVTLTGADGLSASQIAHKDNYLNNNYTLTLPQDYSAVFGHGTFEINDSILNSITIQNTNGKTELVFNQKNITAYIVEENNGNIVIKPVNPKQAHKNVVYLDAGHGGKDPGASGGGFLEKNLNLNILLRLYELLENDPEIKVYASRLDDSYPENISRAHTANYAADIFVSIHHNSSTNSKSNGTEVLYLNHPGEAYPLISSEALARTIQTDLVRTLGTTDRGVIKRTNLIVLNQTTIPAVIVEVGFLSNSGDLAKVASADVRQAAAESLYRSIKEVFYQYPRQ